MALKTDIRGMSWQYPDYFEVGREQVRAFARAIKCDDPACFDEAAAAELGHDSIVAPLTFVSIFAKLVQDDFFRNVDMGMETMQIVQVDQQFVYLKPMCVGDKLCGRMEVQSVNERFGADIVVTKNTCTNERWRGGPDRLHHPDGPRGRRLHPAQMGQGNRAGRQNRVISI